MIPYAVNRWGFSSHMFTARGSVFPKAFLWAIPTSILSAAVWFYQNEYLIPEVEQKVRLGVATSVLTGFSAILGFLLIFRTQKAYGRYWDCAMYLQKARGEWFNASSNLVSFCTNDARKAHEVKKFQQQVVRLISLLFNSAIGEVCCVDMDYEVIDPLMDKDSMTYLQSKAERCEVVMQWIQRLVVDAIRAKIVDVDPPIVSRVFQEFSLGIVNIASAKKITIIPFPFPYAQMMQMLLVFQALAVPMVTGYGFHKWWVASLVTLTMITLTWSIHFTACELEMPFGTDPNDLPLAEMVLSMNDSLCNLLQEQGQSVPIMHIPEAKLGLPLGAEDRIPWNAQKCSDDRKAPSGDDIDKLVVTIDNDPSFAQRARSRSADMDTEIVSQLSELGSQIVQIEPHLAQIVQKLACFPRVEEKVDRLNAEVKQIGVVSQMCSQYMTSGLVGRAPSQMLPSAPADAGSNSVWFCGARRADNATILPPEPPFGYPRQQMPSSGACQMPTRLLPDSMSPSFSAQ